ncbi:SAM-dependent methyltransferase [Microbacterium foliorum]|uniref:SAM-dependent methyltransferase n=1 Tax=Microbacterium foliorum TaxID=104336 RepID=A0ABU1HMW9_9MICO|nr:class I SAM-dependent methyltransferase [Microbacterium foliorum]MDR6141381.1 SAM-dependent methyltransferase [Microbacterium foliorum]
MVDDVLAKSFTLTGADYDRYRPGFPPAAADVVMPHSVRTALDLGAGTGKFTELLGGRAERVVAVEPSEPMLEILRSKLPGVEAHLGSAERIPMESEVADVVTVAQAFHWFDEEAACAEIARVLTPGGTLGLIWNRFDPTCAWDRAAHRIAHPAVGDADVTTSTVTHELPGFDFVRHEQIHSTERIRRDAYLGRWSTVSTFLVADEAARAEMFAAIEAVLDSDPETRDHDEYDLPIVTDVFVYRRA